MATIAVLGIGLLGRGFAENLLDQGHQLRVWNRTASKAAPLAERGAHVASDPADAARGAERVHLVLAADDAVDQVIAALRPSLGQGVPILNHSTNLPARVAERAPRLRAEGVRYLHAPVFMSPRDSRAGTGLMLISGPAPEVGELHGALDAMTGRVLHLGERPDHAAVVKITGNGMLLMLTAAMGDLFTLARAQGLSEHDVVALFEAFGPTPAGMGKRLLRAGEEPASFELTMGRKDCQLMIDAAGGRGALTVLPVVADAMDRAIEAGLGQEDFAIFAKPTEAG